jgi:hypothetical protein
VEQATIKVGRDLKVVPLIRLRLGTNKNSKQLIRKTLKRRLLRARSRKKMRTITRKSSKSYLTRMMRRRAMSSPKTQP